MLTEPRTIPLSASQQRDVHALLAQARALQAQSQGVQERLNLIARTVIGGTDLDPDSLTGCPINMQQPEVGIVILPPLPVASTSPADPISSTPE